LSPFGDNFFIVAVIILSFAAMGFPCDCPENCPASVFITIHFNSTINADLEFASGRQRQPIWPGAIVAAKSIFLPLGKAAHLDKANLFVFFLFLLV
jgi:hypothetical protein